MMAVRTVAKSMFIITLKKVVVERGDHGQAAIDRFRFFMMPFRVPKYKCSLREDRLAMIVSAHKF